MASLLPGAGQKLAINKKDKGMVPVLGNDVVETVKQRMGIFEKRYGSRFAEMRVNEFVRNKHQFDPNVELAVLRSVEIDSQFENEPETAPSAMLGALKRIRVAISILQGQGFNHVVIATDHGFFMNNQVEAGDVCPKPDGNWLITHERIALGSGNANDHHFVIPVNQAGLKSDFSHIAGPNSMAAYSKGNLYFHGGASLQECIVPVMEIKLKTQDAPAIKQADVSLIYKKGATVITTQRPIIEIKIDSVDMFSQAESFEILLEAQKRNGDVVGEAKVGGVVNAATRTVSLQEGESQKITLIMDEDFEGAFIVKALNPNTLTEYAKLKLKTDYMV